ncbi:MAG TPA: thiosulfate oxidation carrier protein SoxY [Burkholderiales bacterium]|nr:thiosulfate oxidation carrier protein SoxY [Burkholderiales bacterium]
MNRRRRTLLELAAGTGALAAAGLFPWASARAATWNKSGFESKAATDAIKNIGAANMIDSKDIAITAPDIAENGAVVPVAVTSRIPNTQSISIIAEKNPFPLAATFDVSSGLEPYASVRIKIAQTSNVRAVVKADGKFYTSVKEVKVTIGGCG